MRPYIWRTRCSTRDQISIPIVNLIDGQTAIGKVDEVLGPINQLFFTIKPQEGIVATSFKAGDRFYIGGDKLLPLEKYIMIYHFYLYSLLNFVRFLPKPKPPPGQCEHYIKHAINRTLMFAQVRQNPRELAADPEEGQCAGVEE